jgi:biotin transport system substrate-specific component
VFSNFRGGYEVLLGPTGGFIFSFLVSATGIALMKSKDKNWVIDIPVMLFFGFIITYLIGIPVFIINTGNTLESSMGFFTPYFLWDLAKLALAFTTYLMLPKEVLNRIYPEMV